jgi:hypothetical protein
LAKFEVDLNPPYVKLLNKKTTCDHSKKHKKINSMSSMWEKNNPNSWVWRSNYVA